MMNSTDNEVSIEAYGRLAADYVSDANRVQHEGLKDFYSECAANAVSTVNMLLRADENVG